LYTPAACIESTNIEHSSHPSASPPAAAINRKNTCIPSVMFNNNYQGFAYKYSPATFITIIVDKNTA